MSLFRILKYSSVLFFLGKHRKKLFRVIVVLLFAGATSILYQDVAFYLQEQHPGALIYALVVKFAIVYGALAFVLWQFRPKQKAATQGTPSSAKNVRQTSPTDRLSALEDVSQKPELHRRYERILRGNSEKKRLE